VIVADNKVNLSFLLARWLEGGLLCNKFQKPDELDDNRLVSVEEMSRLRWAPSEGGVGGFMH
jgi:hypothetical protein